MSSLITSQIRRFQKQKLFALINVFGLAIGLTACTLLIVFIDHEYSYDQSYLLGERLYRIEATASIPGQPVNESPNFFGAAYDLLPAEFAEIETVARLQQRDGTVVKDNVAATETFTYVDPEFTSLFDFPLVEGSYVDALNTPDGIVLTQQMALRYLGPGPWVGQTLLINNEYEREVQVKAVIETLPGNTHFDIDFLLAINPRLYEIVARGGTTDLERWNGLPFRVYVLLAPNSVHNIVQDALYGWVDKHFPPEIQALVGISGSELFAPRLIRVRDIHMGSPVQFDMRPTGNQNAVLGFAGIALLILVIACINFTNLATATASLRAREVAVRKVMGASRTQLFVQFELESIIAAFAALVIAVFMVVSLLPVFSNYTERELDLLRLLQPTIVLIVLAMTTVVGLLAGLHPALILSGFQPAHILQANQPGIAGGMARSALVLFQFTVSAALIIVTLLVYVQTEHARQADMGYVNADKLMVRGIGGDQVNAERIHAEISKLPQVRQTSLASFSPGDGVNTGLSLRVPGMDERLIIFYRAVYPAFFQQFGIEPVAGRLLSDDFEADRTIFISDPNSTQPQQVNVVVNEMAVKRLGFASPDSAIGQVYYRGRQNQIENTIVGVVPNVHLGNPRTDMDAEIYMYIPAEIDTLLVTFDPADYRSVADAVSASIADLYPRLQIDVQHLQDNINDQFREETIQSTLLFMFSALAVLIACMGLFALASFTVNQRTREIGIRKVMGASVRNIVVLLAIQFARPVLIANVIAWPVCWYAVSEWISAFNRQIDLATWFVLVGIVTALVTIVLALATVSAHTIRVARTTPIKSLRYQ